MSTKCSLAYGDTFHLYQECFDEDNVYLELEGIEYEATLLASNGEYSHCNLGDD